MNLLSSALLSGGSIIDLDGTVFVQAILFFLAFGILYVLVFKPMLAVFDARENAIDGAKIEAQKLQGEASAAGHKFDEELSTVRATASVERDRLRDDGQKLERSILEAVKKETDQQMKAAEAKLADEAVKLRADLRVSAPNLGRQIAAKLLSREVT